MRSWACVLVALILGVGAVPGCGGKSEADDTGSTGEGSGGRSDESSGGIDGSSDATGGTSPGTGGSADAGDGGSSVGIGGGSGDGGSSGDSGGAGASDGGSSGASDGGSSVGIGGDGGSGDAGAGTAGAAPGDCPDGCAIGALCVPDGFHNPDNYCQHCDTGASATAWTDNDGASCDDGLFCTAGDTCAGGDCAGNPRDCDDGVACNGTETCDDDLDTCVAGQSQCDDGELCAAETDSCVTTCSGCAIETMCYGEGQPNPADPCQHCDTGASATAWTDNDGASCDDGLFCTVDDTCSAGNCAGNARDCDDGLFCTGSESCNETSDICEHSDSPCADDGDFCNGIEYCDMALDQCTSSGSPCSAGDDCHESSDECCTPNAYQACNGDGDVAWYDSCDNELALVEDCIDGANAACADGVCGCQPGWTGENCDSCVVHVALWGDDANSGHSWDEAKRTVQEGIDTAESGGCTAWVAIGTYYPTAENAGTGGRYRTVLLKTGVAVYGGFQGVETSFAQRALLFDDTVLSGDVGAVGDASDNAYHVVTGADGAVLDGFTITGGNADGSFTSPHNTGGGMYNNGVSPAVANCTFYGNTAYNGGGMTNHNASSPTLTNCTFSDNSAYEGGGGCSTSSTPHRRSRAAPSPTTRPQPAVGCATPAAPRRRSPAAPSPPTRPRTMAPGCSTTWAPRRRSPTAPSLTIRPF